MTLDDLIRMHKEHRSCIKADPEAHAMSVVVRALRDEVEYWLERDSMYETAGMVNRRFNDILSGAGDKAAGGPTSNDGYTAQPGEYAPAADPAVCEWTIDGRNLWFAWCDKQMGHRSYPQAPTNCPTCGKPIKFTEPKP